jgi:hypothetical protein
MVHHVMDVKQPLARVASQGVALDKLSCRCPTELTWQYILHLIENIVWMIGFERN